MTFIIVIIITVIIVIVIVIVITVQSKQHASLYMHLGYNNTRAFSALEVLCHNCAIQITDVSSTINALQNGT